VASPLVFLFDVDGTLITARGAGRRALGVALAKTFGTTGPIQRYDFRGKTDPCIVRDLMLAAGVPEADIRARLAACFAAYVEALEEAVGDGGRVEVMPGVADLVRVLGEEAGSIVGLLTGNIEAGARVKLATTGLLPYFRVGAYGSDDPDRARLPAIAAARVERLTGRPVRFDEMVIIGDTPLDVECARACGATAVAVATGQHALEELAACGPDLLFPDFSDVAAALGALARR
jgi:phosphoglycolate phosphatase-like HAD superfamily hydrolase